MNHKQIELENPERLAELSPKDTLMRIGLGEKDIICDIGAGSGIFTIPAAGITKNTLLTECRRIMKSHAKLAVIENG